MPKLFVFILLIAFFSFSVSPVRAGDNTTVLLAEINQFRKTNGLPPAKIDPLTCKFAALRAREAAKKFSHDGFYKRVRNKTMPYPKYKRVTENLAKTKRQNVVKLWIKSPTHAANMLKETSRVCVQKYGNYYAYEGVEI